MSSVSPRWHPELGCFNQHPKYIQFMFIEEGKKQNICTWKKLITQLWNLWVINVILDDKSIICLPYVIQTSTEMARAETIESAGETGGGGNGPLPRHNTCRMELPRSFHSWPGLLTTTITTGSGTGTGPMNLQHNHHHLHPLQAIYLSYPLPYPHPEGQDEPQSHQQLPALSPSPTPPSSPPCNQREDRGGGYSGEHTGKIMVFTYSLKKLCWRSLKTMIIGG